ncbi:MAG: choice-of-anchor J domain-containing protein [Muribaculaceae bacterium]|nr:choice-of-anchor J domain-containing protein [Muribaculaceae bacterium]
MTHRYISTALAMLALCAGAQAEVIRPESSYSLRFSDLKNDEGLLPDTWSTYGKGLRPSEEWQELFDADGQGPSYRLLTLAGTTGAFSNSSYLEDLTADEWLVTPAIHVVSDEEVLQLTVGAYGSYGLNEYYVFVSDKGPAREDFTAGPVIVSTLTGDKEAVKTRKSVTPLRGYADKDIWVAFVNRSKDKALLGLTAIEMAPYLMEVTDATPMVVPEGGKFQVSVITNTVTPAEIRGMKATLSTSTGVERTIELDKTILPTGTQVNITFPDEFTMESESFDYTVTITPALADINPTVITGVVTQPTTTYPPVAVVEEFTGTWCPNCPRGAAFMEYYHDTYDGVNEGKVIGIALHSGDPMQTPDRAYLASAQAASGSTGFPSAFFSRNILGDPSDEQTVRDLLSEKYYSSIKLTEVIFDPLNSDEMEIEVAIENAYSKNNLEQRLAIVIVENDVIGVGDGFSQSNGYSGVPQLSVESTYGKDLWPYFEPYSLAPTAMPYTMCSYNHVARAIYPDYEGSLIETSCQAEVPVVMGAMLELPDNIASLDNISVIALLIDDRTGRILYADEMPASRFNSKEPDSVDRIDADGGVTVAHFDGKIKVSGTSGMTVDVYAMDGMLLKSCATDAAEIEIPVGEFEGIAIVRVGTASGNFVRKIIL